MRKETVFQLSSRQEVSWMGLEDMGGNFNYVLCSLTQVCVRRHENYIYISEPLTRLHLLVLQDTQNVFR